MNMPTARSPALPNDARSVTVEVLMGTRDDVDRPRAELTTARPYRPSRVSSPVAKTPSFGQRQRVRLARDWLVLVVDCRVSSPSRLHLQPLSLVSRRDRVIVALATRGRSSSRNIEGGRAKVNTAATATVALRRPCHRATLRRSACKGKRSRRGECQRPS